ncbi:GNAT family N-acetyltransferase [Butyrivibrio proteoclasticus]|uniref:GNAT family N-acetyltransferase n=1 Tax=Butyrivibrio proteoclasticus TaxID=43305 RepID=UPI000ACBA231|nr:GNAT family N-acetyltransferase [Butyrivibrio proteoclasticus]
MSVKLQKANREDMHELWEMQVDAFKDLLDKYQDYDMSPAAESYERILQKYDFTGTIYYFIVADGIKVGGIRVIDKMDGSRKRISPIWIMHEFRNKGYAQQAIQEVEKLYGDDNWSLDTILQEKGNIHIYEKLGYKRTGKIERISYLMDIVYFEKN